MKIAVVLMAMFLLVSLPAPGCHAARSFRDTPVVDVVRNYSEDVVNIRTEKVLNLKNTPEWGKYGAQLDSMLKKYFIE